MRIVNLGSLNMDQVYGVDHFVSAGETILANSFAPFCGGKGLNQSVALAKAGAQVYHAGAVGTDGAPLTDTLKDSGVDTRHLQTLPGASGTALIQVTPAGQNCIIVYGGTNQQITPEYIDSVLEQFSPGDLLLAQNETSSTAYAIEKAHSLGLKIAFNPSPITPDIFSYPLNLVDYFLLNEVEGNALADIDSTDFNVILNALHQRFPKAHIVLTVGSQGVYYKNDAQTLKHGTYSVPVVDTTAAGDTFSGFFLASIAKGHSEAEALHYASCASSIAVSRKGAAPSIPTWDELTANPNFGHPIGI